MSITISNKTTVFKFALALYDYLLQNGHAKEANELSLLVDSCYPNDNDALKAHLEAFRLIQHSVLNEALMVPPQYLQALEAAITYIEQNVDGSKDKGDKEFQEIELKLRVQDPQLGEKILRDPLLLQLSGNAQPRLKEYETTYYDTREHLFINHRVCYRIRNSAGKYTATLKGFGSSQQGLSIRSEWNRPLPEHNPTLEPFQDLPIGQELASLVKDQEIIPIFVTRFKRSALDLVCQDGSQIELALDIGEIAAGNKKEPICELELELKSGDMQNIVRLGETLSKTYKLVPEELSKYQRGMLLAGFINPEI